MNEKETKLYQEWLQNLTDYPDLLAELHAMQGKEDLISDCFYRELDFGTAGLRGVLGPGTNRMNELTVGRASRGYGRYLKTLSDHPSMAIAYDSRHKSEQFARQTAQVMASLGVHVYFWPELMPTPALSFAIRYYHCQGGVVITASHNPAKYNGYKAYDPTGCQIDEAAAEQVMGFILEEEMFSPLSYSFEQGVQDGMIELIPETVYDAFLEAAGEWAAFLPEVDKTVSIAYTPLYGTGRKPVTDIFRRHGFTNVSLVEEQAEPNGDFPTCPYPNPEIREAMEVGLQVAKEKQADLLIATDPDADRIGIAVRDGNDYRLLTGNQTGMLLLDWLCKVRKETGNLPENPVAIKSIVSTDMIYLIAKEYGVTVWDVLTGFKNIAPLVTKLDAEGQKERYIFGYEESYGYMLGTHVRDKDSVSAALMIAEMFAYYKGKNLSLLQVLDSIYRKFGYYINTTHSYEYPGESGFGKMQEIMDAFREHPFTEIAGIPVREIRDYINGRDGMAPSNVIKYVLEGSGMVVLRPSGTEPKLKLYVGIGGPALADAEAQEQKIVAAMNVH